MIVGTAAPSCTASRRLKPSSLMKPTSATSASRTLSNCRWRSKASSDRTSCARPRPSFRRAGVVLEPVTLEHGELTRQAFLDFGKGRHKAGLKFGDFFYGLAKATVEALLFKDQDFALADIRPA